jgi:PPK2 family polyphosphate:nucleotide phosphotransferase
MDGVLTDLQERLFAEGRTGGKRRLLLVLQGMDTSGKGGVMRHAVALFDPQGVHIKAFGRPTDEELEHHFLWRIEREIPGPGMVGIFDRSHYEDVLVARVRALAPAEDIERRYDEINEFEAGLAAEHTRIVKCLLHISAEEQKARLLARLEKPTKRWKYDPGDLDDRARWHEYQRAYEVAIERTNTEVAPWLVVPSDRKWYRNLAIATVLREMLEEMDLTWPEPDYDVDAERARLESVDP